MVMVLMNITVLLYGCHSYGYNKGNAWICAITHVADISHIKLMQTQTNVQLAACNLQVYMHIHSYNRP